MCEININNLPSSDWMDKMINDLCLAFGTTREKVYGNDRKRENVSVRQIVMSVNNATGSSLQKSGGEFFKDHATVNHSKKVVENLIETESTYRSKVIPILDDANIRNELFRFIGVDKRFWM